MSEWLGRHRSPLQPVTYGATLARDHNVAPEIDEIGAQS